MSNNDWVEISHDAFGRFSIVRSSVETYKTCAWCGQARKNGKLFEYGVQNDDRPNRINPIKGLFCSIDCMRTYNL